MKAFITILTTLVALSDIVSAHYRFTSLVVGGVNTGEYVHVRRNTNYTSPVTDVLSKDIVCNAGGLSSGPATQIATVAAGSTVNIPSYFCSVPHTPYPPPDPSTPSPFPSFRVMIPYPRGPADCSSTRLTTYSRLQVNFAMDQAIYHDGPVIVWLSPAAASSSNVTTYDGSGPWAKIWELGAQTGNGQIKFPASNQAGFNFQIPSCTPPGEYLLRIEIGLHSASAKAGAQFYISCAQIKVTDSGSSSGLFSPTARFP
ncbi:cellulose-growth-specific protein [Colletotrichum salicis]|uniref:lytic cellulose monooxygenase (C4-dehydrogenating) n=1 Tax=Colletotrichum salicis TaxID=1209931 RepID=A0A135U5T6_9PEZI|nr:cellulose-growth-specific protein [Colletotrichum salicis]